MKKRAILLAALATAGGFAAPARAAAPQGIHVEAREQVRPTEDGLAKAAPHRATRVRSIGLAHPRAELDALADEPRRGAPLRIGLSRAVEALATEAATRQAIEWEAMPGGGRVGALSITSPGAAAVRAALVVERLPDAAVLRFKAPGDAMLFESGGADVRRTLEQNLAAGQAGEDARSYWSPVIEGETVLVEIELPAESDPRDVRVALPRVSHLVTSAANTFATPTAIGRSASCNVDAMCTTGWSNQMNAVAQMVFSDGSGSYLCTGTLLADSDAASSTPYFLTARHCIGSQALASSLVTYWFYRSSACNSGAPGAYRQLAGGGALLYSATSTDTAFLRLNNTPPQGTYFAGWSVGSVPGTGSAAAALHQPRGDLLKLSQGRLSGYATCTAPTNGSFSCSGASSASATYYSVAWSSGITEPGSSGSALFSPAGQVLGQLYGGGSACDGSGGDFYGRFDVAYNAGLRNWLGATSASLTVSKTGGGAGTVTSSPAGISCGTACTASYAAGTSVTLTATPAAGSRFAGWSGACSGTGTCTVSLTQATNVTASFALATATLTVANSGGGAVTSAPAGVSCGSTCSASFPTGTAVTLTATPAAGMSFAGWSGSCSGTGACTVTMNTAHSVAAAFAGRPNLVLTQAASAAPSSGKDLVYTITVANRGTGTANDIVVTDTLPPGGAFIWASGSCGAGPGRVTCALGTLAPAASASVKVVVRPASAGSLTNAASVASTEPDAVPADNSASLTTAVAWSPAARIVQRYRLYSPVTQEHLFTTDANEYQVLGAQAGTWVQEGPAGKVLDNPGSFNGVAATPYYRLYNTQTRWHHWTTDPNEYYTLAESAAWSAEDVDGYIFPAAAAGTVRLYRLLYPDGRGLHHWTIDPAEYDALVSRFGWIGEGGSGHVLE